MLGARYLATGNLIDITKRVTELKCYDIYTKKTAISGKQKGSIIKE